MKPMHPPAARQVDIVSDHACPSCGAGVTGRGKGRPGDLCDSCQAIANAAKSAALRAAKRRANRQPPKGTP